MSADPSVAKSIAMSINMCSVAKGHVCLLDDPKKNVLSNTAEQSTLSVAVEAGDSRSTGQDENKSIGFSSVTEVHVAAEAAWQVRK